MDTFGKLSISDPEGKCNIVTPFYPENLVTEINPLTRKYVSPQDLLEIKNRLTRINNEYNGEIFWNYITLKKYDHCQNAVLVSVDITNLKKAEEQITEEQKKAEASAKLAAFGEMSAGIAHEINNPLSIIKGTVQRINKLRSKGTLTEEKFDGLDSFSEQI